MNLKRSIETSTLANVGALLLATLLGCGEKVATSDQRTAPNHTRSEDARTIATTPAEQQLKDLKGSGQSPLAIANAVKAQHNFDAKAMNPTLCYLKMRQ